MEGHDHETIACLYSSQGGPVMRHKIYGEDPDHG